ncbi:hypothetical protein [Acidocella aminolytica]|nr:hypothetical protein [Acidocella aminolytica]
MAVILCAAFVGNGSFADLPLDYVPPLTSNVQIVRAILLANATATAL